MALQNSYIEILAFLPQMWLCLKMGSLKRELNENKIIRQGPNPMWLVSLNAEDIGTHRGKAMWRHWEMIDIHKSRGGASEETNPETPWSWTSGLQN